MRKIWLSLLILTTFTQAAYNPFFNEQKPRVEQKPYIKAITPRVMPKRKNIELRYFGFVHSKKGKFALVRFNEKNIIIQENNSLYLDKKSTR